MISTCFRCRTGRNYVPKTQICITRAQSCYPTCFGVREAAGFIFHCKTLGTQRSALEYTQLLPSLLKGPPLQVILFCPRQSRVCRAGNPSQTMPKSHQAEKILEEHWSTEFNQTQRNYRPLSFIDATRESCFASFIQWLTHKHPQQQRLKPQVSPTSTAYPFLLDIQVKLLLAFSPSNFLFGFLSIWCLTSIRMMMDDPQGNVRGWWRQFPNSR